jgi:PAS domain S-box-containing protein
MLDVTETVLAREAVQESELRLSTLSAMVPEILYTVTPDGAPDYVSKRLTDYSGQPAAELEGHGWMKVVHPDDRSAVASAWRTPFRAAPSMK